ncbi:F-box/kelch-repeat protein At3g06240 [Linum grandiflorum]
MSDGENNHNGSLMSSGRSDNNRNGSRRRTCTYLTEDIVINILQWLPVLSCIAKFRCVCRSWRNLLSDPNLIRKIIFSQPSHDQKRLKILIAGVGRGHIDRNEVAPLVCSVYSYETLRPITDQQELYVDHMRRGGGETRVVGCCNGIFCMSNTTKLRGNVNYSHSMILWNPVTSETKIIPPGFRHPCYSSRTTLDIREERIGFGYDPKTKDYKIVRVLELEETQPSDDDDRYHYDPAEFYHGPLPLIFTEVYSLRNDSWKKLDVATHSVEDMWLLNRDLSQQLDTSQNEKCYWFREDEIHGSCDVISFDMSTEVFELVTTPFPIGLTHHDEGDVHEDYEIISGNDHTNSWWPGSPFMLKNGALLITFASSCYKCINRPDDEIWVLLKCGVAESWTKLFTGRAHDNTIYYLEVWKDCTYIGARSLNMCLCDSTGQVIRDNIEIEGTVGFQARVFTPTRVSLSQLV